MTRGAAGILALALVGCAVGPDYLRPDAVVSDAYKEATGWKVAEPHDESNRGNWWEIFGDPQLSALIESINISNQNVRLAEAQFRQAQALAAQSRAALFPTLDANASITRSRSPTGLVGGTSAGRIINNRSVALSSSWELDLWGGLRRALESSAAGAQASAADLAAARLSAQAELASSYFQLRILDAQKQLLEDTVAGYQKSLDLTKNRYDAGVAAKVDLVQAETQLKSTRAQAIDTGVQRAQLEHAIAILIGKAPAEFSIAPVPLAVTMPRVPAGLPSELLERRPDVVQAEQNLVAVNASIGVAKSLYFPSISLTGLFGSLSTAAGDFLTGPARTWTVAADLAGPIFTFGGISGQVRTAEAAQLEAMLFYRSTILNAFRDTNDALVGSMKKREESEAQARRVRALRDYARLSRLRFDNGVSSYVEVLVAENDLFSAELTAVNTQAERYAQLINVYKAMGGGWVDASDPLAAAKK